jgi:UDP-N-acetyl-alpha-D-muramoyl-L-alanyl-L-glutamate epimerase
MAKLNLEELRRRHGKIIFTGLDSSFTDGVFEARFDFRLEPDIEFHPTLRFLGVDEERVRRLDPALIRAWLVRIGMVELLSYWKAACPPEIVVAAGHLEPAELSFWKKLLANGMSEFFYVNDVDGWQDDFVRFSVEAKTETYAIDAEPKPERYLTPVGGGKDSAVTVELIKEAGLDQALFLLNPGIAAQRTADVSGEEQRITVERTIDSKLIELNDAGYLNGHTPFSALLAFVSTLAAYLHGYRYAALSNEWSANEENIISLGHPVNHQYSKSYGFEKDFREYLRERLSVSIEYFSALRPLHELQIAKLFSRHEAYFSAFVSCNRKIAAGEWCGKCAKCLFAAIMLSAFLAPERVKAIFRKDILDDGSLLPILKELTGLTELKSLDCVGTRDESKAALHLAIRRYGGAELPSLLAFAKTDIVADDAAAHALAERIMASHESDAFLPTTLKEILNEETHAQPTA